MKNLSHAGAVQYKDAPDMKDQALNLINEEEWDKFYLLLSKNIKKICPFQMLIQELSDVITLEKALSVIENKQLKPNWEFTNKDGMNPFFSNQVLWFNKLATEAPDWLTQHGDKLSLEDILDLPKVSKMRIFIAIDYALCLISNKQLVEAIFKQIFSKREPFYSPECEWHTFFHHKWSNNSYKHTDLWVKHITFQDNLQILIDNLIELKPHKHAPKKDSANYVVGFTQIIQAYDIEAPSILSKSHFFKTLDYIGIDNHNPDTLLIILDMLNEHIFMLEETREEQWLFIASCLWNSLNEGDALNALKRLCQMHNKHFTELMSNCINFTFNNTQTKYNMLQNLLTLKISRFDKVTEALINSRHTSCYIADIFISIGKATLLPIEYVQYYATKCFGNNVSNATLMWCKNSMADKSHPHHSILSEAIRSYLKRNAIEVRSLTPDVLESIIDIPLLPDGKVNSKIVLSSFLCLIVSSDDVVYTALKKLDSADNIAKLIRTLGRSPYGLLSLADEPIFQDGILKAMN